MTGIGLGPVEISATYADVRGALSFTVTPVITYTINVFVVDASNNQRIPSATITYVGDRGSKTATTNSVGSVSMPGVPAGRGTFSASAQGHITASQAIEVFGDMAVLLVLTPSTSCPTIGFDSLQSEGAPFSTLLECGFVVRATTPNWTTSAGFGHPPPFVKLSSPPGTTTDGELNVTSSSGAPFKFISVDIYSSTTPIPYIITGQSGSRAVFTIQNTQPNTFGDFATVSNPQSPVLIDALTIRLSNPSAECCQNPMGLDNIRLSF